MSIEQCVITMAGRPKNEPFAQELAKLSKQAPLRYMLFDAPQLQGEDLHNAPLIER